MPENDLIIGLDIGGTSTAVVLGNAEGEVIDRLPFDTKPSRGFEACYLDLCERIERLRTAAADRDKRAACLSVSIGGPIDLDRGVVLSPPNLPGWDNIPLKTMLEKKFGLPVYIEHDGNAGALAEWLFGAAKGASNVIFLTMGTGFGGGLILDGRLYRGTTFLAGEAGHVRLADDGPEAYGKIGSWEAFCSGTGLARLAALRQPERWGMGSVSAKQLALFAEQGDKDALAVIEEAGRYLGKGLAILLDLLNPEKIVIGSLAVRLGEKVLDPAREVMKQEALPAAYSACRLVPAALGEKLGDVASLCAAITAMS
jgi:glucokinase